MKATDDGWLWLETPSTNTNIVIYSTFNSSRAALSPIATDLSYLIERLHVTAVYKVLKIGGIKVMVVRLYAIPNDVDGNRFLEDHRRSYRRGKSVQWHENKYKSIMKNMMAVLDYSQKHWETPELIEGSKLLIFSSLVEFKPFSSKTLGSGPYFEAQSLDSHITRLFRSESFFIINNARDGDSLETRLTDVYNSLNFAIRLGSEVLSDVQDIQGMKSELYNYQKESVAKMFGNESYTFLKEMPYLIPIRKLGKVYYFNTLAMTFNLNPEYYTTPRGGILAENMGLGKTIICLALVCLTRFETSETPERFIISEARDYKIRPLFDQCVRHINRHSVPWKKHCESLSSTCINALKKSPGFFYLKSEELSNKRNLSRARPMVKERKYLLTGATLIVCPDNLFKQWVSEIEKHVEQGVLSIHFSDKAGKLPSAIELVNHDIVLMAVSAYVHEDPITSELSKIYWKRFIIDEGHSMNQRSTRAVELSKEIKVERRWAVTGTPTAGMTKLHMNETFDKNSSSYTVKRVFNAKDDLARLGLLICNFFQIQPWVNHQDLWNKIIVRPFVGNAFNSKLSLHYMLDSLVVRHSIEQIGGDVTLSPLYHKPIFLTPSYHNKLSVNLFVAVLAINAVSSEREDKDYMFHPGSKSDLGRLVTNLQRATFYWTGFSIEDLKSMIYISNLCSEKRNEDGSNYYSHEDLKLLERSVRACKTALADKYWRTVSTIHEMNYFVGGLDGLFSKNFQINKFSSEVSVFGAPQLYSLQKFYFKNRFSPQDTLEERIQTYSNEFWKDYWKEATKKNAERVKKNDGQAIDVSKVSEELEKQDKISLKSSNKSKFEDPNHMKSITGRIETSHNNTSSPTPTLNTNKSNKLSRIMGSSSAKLSYMVSKLLENSFSNVKSIIFFEFEDSAYYLSEALDLLGLDYTLYATSVPKNERPQKIRDFSECKGSHTLIMDLKLASHGLTITAATKVYFLSPVWKRSTEAQAIKRAHRIGQKNPVYVETLILKGTLEEEMYKKRLAADDELNVPVADDNQIQDYILKFEFLKLNDTAPYIEFKSKTSSTQKYLNKKEYDESELLEPNATLIKSSYHWNVPLFTKKALDKLSENGKKNEISKKDIKVDEAITKKEEPKVKFEQVQNKVTNAKIDNKVPEKRTIKSEEPGSESIAPKKKVRFT